MFSYYFVSVGWDIFVSQGFFCHSRVGHICPTRHENTSLLTDKPCNKHPITIYYCITCDTKKSTFRNTGCYTADTKFLCVSPSHDVSNLHIFLLFLRLASVFLHPPSDSPVRFSFLDGELS